MEVSNAWGLTEGTTLVSEILLDQHTKVYTTARLIVEKYVALVIAVLGLGGNFLTLLTMTRTKMKEQPTSVYLCGLAVADGSALLALLCRSQMNAGVVDLEPTCHYCGALSTFSTSCSAFITIGVTAERVVAVWFPLKVKSWMTRKMAWVLVVLSFAAAFALYLPRVFKRSSKLKCQPDEEYLSIYVIQVMICYSIGPSLVLLILNAAIAIRLNLRAKTSAVQRSAPSEPNTRKVTVLVLIISTTYILFNLPSVFTIVYVLTFRAALFRHPEANALAEALANTLLMVNHAANFWLYLAASSVFRKNLRSLVKCRSPNPNTPPNSSSMKI
jgi:hypothetical protein